MFLSFFTVFQICLPPISGKPASHRQLIKVRTHTWSQSYRHFPAQETQMPFLNHFAELISAPSQTTASGQMEKQPHLIIAFMVYTQGDCVIWLGVGIPHLVLHTSCQHSHRSPIKNILDRNLCSQKQNRIICFRWLTIHKVINCLRLEWKNFLSMFLNLPLLFPLNFYRENTWSLRHLHPFLSWGRLILELYTGHFFDLAFYSGYTFFLNQFLTISKDFLSISIWPVFLKRILLRSFWNDIFTVWG